MSYDDVEFDESSYIKYQNETIPKSENSNLKMAKKFIGKIYLKKFRKFRRMIIKLQNYFKTHHDSIIPLNYQQNIIKIQTTFRRSVEQKRLNNIKKNIIIIQKNFRCYFQRKKFLKIKNSVYYLIPKIINFLIVVKIHRRKKLRNYVLKIINSAFDKIIYSIKYQKSIKLNSYFRLFLFKINNPKLLSYLKKKKQERINNNAAIKIQTNFRSYYQFIHLHYLKFSTDLIRGYWKMLRLSEQIQKMRPLVIIIQRKVKNYLNQKHSYIEAMKIYLEQKYNKFLNKEITKIKQYFQSKHTAYDCKKNSEKKSIDDSKITFFSKIVDIDLYNSTIHTYGDEFWIEKFYKFEAITKKIYSSLFFNIQLAECHTSILNGKGKIFSFGWNENGQCNLDNSVKTNNNNQIQYKNISATNAETYAININGEMCSNKISYTNANIFNLIVSDHSMHVYAISKNMVYYIRNNKIDIINFSYNNHIKIKQISTGKHFVMFLAENGHLFSMGKKNNKGELGHGDFVVRNEPKIIKVFIENGDKIISVKCGYKHTIALASNGKVYSWGSNSHGQCSVDIKSNFNKPMWIKLNSRIIFISAGFRTSFFMNENRKIFYCGKGGVNNNETYELKEIEFPFNIKYTNLIENHIYPIKLNCTWNESLSVFYVTYADYSFVIKNNKNINFLKIKWINDKLSNIWDNDDMNILQNFKNIKGIGEYI